MFIRHYGTTVNTCNICSIEEDACAIIFNMSDGNQTIWGFGDNTSEMENVLKQLMDALLAQDVRA